MNKKKILKIGSIIGIVIILINLFFIMFFAIKGDEQNNLLISFMSLFTVSILLYVFINYLKRKLKKEEENG